MEKLIVSLAIFSAAEGLRIFDFDDNGNYVARNEGTASDVPADHVANSPEVVLTNEEELKRQNDLKTDPLCMLGDNKD